MSMTMRGRRSIREMGDVASDLADVLEDGAELVLRLIGSMTEGSTRVTERLPRLKLPTSGCDCRIPPPCWMPVSLGELTDHVCEGATATVRFRITNCGASPRQLRLEAVSPGHPVTITGSPLTLGPMERGLMSAAFAVPAEAEEHTRYEILVWVRGCRDHFLRWIVRVGRRGAECCHEVEVEDCPDLVHHWYDHFYCEHRCGGQ